MPAQKRKNKQKNSENKKSKQQKNNVKEFFKEPVSIIDMMKGKTVQGDRANISDVLAHEKNKMVIFKLVFTSFLMMTLPFATYFVCITALPRLYPLMETNEIQTIGAISSVGMVLLISVGYIIAALLEED